MGDVGCMRPHTLSVRCLSRIFLSLSPFMIHTDCCGCLHCFAWMGRSVDTVGRQDPFAVLWVEPPRAVSSKPRGRWTQGEPAPFPTSSTAAVIDGGTSPVWSHGTRNVLSARLDGSGACVVFRCTCCSLTPLSLRVHELWQLAGRLFKFTCPALWRLSLPLSLAPLFFLRFSCVAVCTTQP